MGRHLLGLPLWLSRASARVLLLALSVSALGPLAHDVHDDDCHPVFVVHDESQHHVRAAPSVQDGTPADHCVGCHFARSSRGPVAWEPSGLAPFARGVLLQHRDGEVRAALSVAPLPARAPPSLA
jgi:hypothetical protein